MSEKPTEKELELAARVNELDDAAARPVLGDGGLFASAVKFLMSRVSRGMISAALTIFIAFHAWKAFNEVQQMSADLQSKRAEAGSAIAEAVALNKQVEGKSTELRTREEELKKIRAEAAAAQAEADAATHSVAGVSARLAQLRAELQQKQAEAKSAKADADAALQEIGGVHLAVLQKEAEVAQAENEAKGEVEGLRLSLRMWSNPGSIANEARKNAERAVRGR